MDKESIFINENLGLVKKVISDKFRYYINLDATTDLEDLIQIGTIALIKAYRGFNKEKGYKFSTYAYKAIWGEILRSKQNLFKERVKDRQIQNILYLDDKRIISNNLVGEGFEENLIYKIDIEKTIKKMPKKQQKYIELYANGKSQCEIAKIFNVSQVTISRALKEFRNIYKREI